MDTPGTNVILERQQRLTEEFVPRADLVLFIMSADRPCTDSEVRFLKYIRQWGKKVVFVLNKVDIFDSDSDVAQARLGGRLWWIPPPLTCVLPGWRCRRCARSQRLQRRRW